MYNDCIKYVYLLVNKLLVTLGGLFRRVLFAVKIGFVVLSGAHEVDLFGISELHLTTLDRTYFYLLGIFILATVLRV